MFEHSSTRSSDLTLKGIVNDRTVVRRHHQWHVVTRNTEGKTWQLTGTILSTGYYCDPIKQLIQYYITKFEWYLCIRYYNNRNCY